MKKNILLISELLTNLSQLREKNEITSTSYNVQLFLLRQLTSEINFDLKGGSEDTSCKVELRKLNIELAKAGTCFQLSN